MRIISGKLKGRRLTPPTNISARPTTDFAREGLFNVLLHRIDFEETTALDLFAGTGSVSLELISRGCKNVTAIELNERHCAFIRKACAELKIDNLLLIKSDAFRFIDKTRHQYDLIFADPPYDLPKLTEIPDLILKNNLLTDDGLLILEHSVKNNFAEHPNFVEQRHYGNVYFSFFEKKSL